RGLAQSIKSQIANPKSQIDESSRPEFSRKGCRSRRRDRPSLTDVKGDSSDPLATEAVLQPIQDVLATIANDFVQPHVAVDRYEKRAITESGGLGVRSESWINQMPPHTQDLRFCLALVHAEPFQDRR